MKIYDCSLSEKIKDGPANKCYGPRENDIVRYLKQYGGEFGHTFVNDWRNADVIFTNDIFPQEYPGKRKVKRMDGVFSSSDLVSRNEVLNTAARQADHVIFISVFSQESYFHLYGGELKQHSVIRNAVDPTIFYPGLIWSDDQVRVAIASASHWERPEKRLNDLLSLADMAPNVEFIILGKYSPDIRHPNNVRFKGYIGEPEEIASTLRQADVMISLFYKDAHPKTMIQGVYCGLPILYTSSGGQREMLTRGVTVPDPVGETGYGYSFYDKVPKLNPMALEDAWNDFRFKYPELKKQAMEFRGRDQFRSMLKEYYRILAG